MKIDYQTFIIISKDSMHKFVKSIIILYGGLSTFYQKLY